MLKLIYRILGLSVLVWVLVVARPTEAKATGVTFTLTAKSAFARALPSLSSPRAASLFKGQTYNVLARSADGLWLKLDYASLFTEAWVVKSYGTVTGDVASLPVAEGTSGVSAPAPTSPAAGATPSASGTATTTVSSPPLAANAYYPTDLPIIPTISQTAREIYQRGLKQGTNPKHFSRVGDCQSIIPYFLAAFDYGNYRLGDFVALQPTIDNFAGSWSRQGQASSRGFNVSNVFVPIWSDPKQCLKNEGPLACELRLNRPSMVVISMETWWGGDASGYESYMRRILDTIIASGAVPILSTKADNIEGTGAINATIVKLAQEYDVPLWNFWAAVQPLPNRGMHSDGFHLTWERNYFDDPAVLQKAWPMRNLTALQAIDAVWRGVSTP